MATLVKFRVHPENGETFAFFPKLVSNFNGYRKNHTCYAHIGQHSPCNVDYVKECIAATESEYFPLKQELESIGYNLKICK